MFLCRLIAPEWLLQEQPGLKKVIEGELEYAKIIEYNALGYNCYYFPNYPSDYESGSVKGQDVDVFEWCFVDCDLKDGKYQTKQAFIEKVISDDGLIPTKVIDSGNGVHAYWRVTGLDAKAYLRLQKRLIRFFDTDPATSSLVQLMRLPDTLNRKIKGSPKPCEVIYDDSSLSYTCEDLDSRLPHITLADEESCQSHYNRCYSLDEQIPITGDLPAAFGALLHKNNEVKHLFTGETDDRTKSDYRLGHIMFANNLTKDEAINVLFNSSKAMTRSPSHRYNYAKNIADKIWTYESAPEKTLVPTSQTVRQILSKGPEVLKGTRFSCNRLLDDTKHGFRLGQVIGIIGGAGVGKTTLTLNMFIWFVEQNPEYDHVFFSLEQPAGEIASRVQLICGTNESLYDKIHIISNYNDDGSYNHFSLSDIEKNVKALELQIKRKIGAVVVDHIGVLKKSTKN